MTEEPEKIQLPFNPRKQDAVLGHLLCTPRFFQQARNRIQASWFQDPICGKVWTALLSWYNTSGRFPSTDELQEWSGSEFMCEDEKTRRQMRSKVSVACNETINFGLDTLSKELQGWLQAMLFRDAAQAAVLLFNRKKFEDCYGLMAKEIQNIRSATFVDDGEHEFGNIAGDIEQEKIDRANACTLGSTLLDRVLLPDGEPKSGSLLPGDQTILLAVQNAGKTRALITIIVANIRQKKSVLWFAHEGRANDLSMLLWCALLRVDRPTLFEMLKTGEGRKSVDNALKGIKQYVTFVPYMKAGMTVEDVEPLIRHKCEERIARNGGKGYDLFVSDYPAKLSTKLAVGGHMAPRHILHEVYNYHVNLALEYKYHSLVAYQSNREGAKVQEGKKGKNGLEEEGRLLVPEDASEAYGPMQTATNIITINRPPTFKAKGWVTYNFCKSRSGETGWAVCCKSDYAKSITHSEKLGGVKYRGTSNMLERMDDYMEQYFGGCIPKEVSLA